MLRWSAALMGCTVLLMACVETSEPTGPPPTPPGDEGELTSAVVTPAGVADAADSRGPARAPERPAERDRRTRPRTSGTGSS